MIAEILKAQRKKRGQTQQEVAEIFNVTRQTVSNWENEKNYPDVPRWWLSVIITRFLLIV